MVRSVCSLLVLLSLIGVGRCDTVIIRPATEKEHKSYTGIFTYILKNGVEGPSASSIQYYGAKSSFGCVKNGSYAFIKIYYDIKKPKAYSLNVSTNFGKFENYKDNSAEVPVNNWTGDICFFQGIWNPSGPAADEVYFTIVKNNGGFDKTNVLFLRVEVMGKIVNSKVLKDIKRFSLSKYLKDDQPGAIEKVTVVGEDTSELITEASNYNRLILGSMKGAIKKEKGFKVETGKQDFTFDQDGEFYMAFFSEVINEDQEKETAIDFVKWGTIESIKTRWFVVEATDEGVKLTPNENSSKLLEGNLKANLVI